MTFADSHCLITGANTSLGFALSRKLAETGAHTILCCRNSERGESALHAIRKKSPSASLDLMICDLASMKSVRGFLGDVKGKYSKLDLLFNNAAVMKQKRSVTEDGFEEMFQVNYLAPFIMMNSLLPLLKNGSSPQILNNGRPSDKLRLDLDDLQFSKNYHMYRSFFMTKLCLLFASLELSRSSERDGVSVVMADPGSFKSDLVRDVPLMRVVKNLLSATVDEAAENIFHVISSGRVESNNGKVFKKRQEYPLNEYWKDASVSEKLWSMTKSMVQNIDGF